MQTSGRQKALRELESSGYFDLPKARRKTGTKSPRRLTDTVQRPVDVPIEVNGITELELVQVREEQHMRIWNEPMITEHYIRTATLVGRQLRYLIRSEHGWVRGNWLCSPRFTISCP